MLQDLEMLDDLYDASFVDYVYVGDELFVEASQVGRQYLPTFRYRMSVWIGHNLCRFDVRSRIAHRVET